MTPTAEQLLDAALGLPDDDRLEFIEALIASLDAGEQPPFNEPRQAVIRQRAEELKTGRVTPIS